MTVVWYSLHSYYGTLILLSIVELENLNNRYHINPFAPVIMSRATSSIVPKKKRVGWTEQETNALIGIWQEENVRDAIPKKTLRERKYGRTSACA